MLETLAGPYIIPHRLNDTAYWHFLEHTLPELLDAVLLDIWWNISFMLDGAPLHFSYTARITIRLPTLGSG
jgi:hypothetical protein